MASLCKWEKISYLDSVDPLPPFDACALWDKGHLNFTKAFPALIRRTLSKNPENSQSEQIFSVLQIQNKLIFSTKNKIKYCANLSS